MKIFWMVGEVSGDLHASYVAKELTQNSEVQQIGIGGANLQNAGVKIWRNFDDINVMGFIEIVKNLKFLLKIEKEIKAKILEENPDILILVDYPGMNLRLAEFATKQKIKVLYYISPKFWAWKKNRIKKLKKYTTYVASIFPFETKILEENGVQVRFVGHPIPEQLTLRLTKNEFAEKFNLNPSRKWIGFFPGSRTSEVERLMPIYLETIQKINAEFPETEFLISQATNQNFDLFRTSFKALKIKTIPKFNYETMKFSDFLIIKSGTTTLEAALLQTPFVLTYITNNISYWIAERVVKIKWIGLPNIIMNKEIIPEFIQQNASVDNFVKYIKKALLNNSEVKNMTTNLSNLSTLLGSKKPSIEVPKLIMEMYNETNKK